MSAGRSSPTRVSMLVRNAFTHDSRVEREARTLTRAGYAVTVVAEGRPGLPRREERDGYDVVRVWRGGVRLPGLRLLDYRRRLVAALLETRPQILHGHDGDALPAIANVARRLGIPFVHDAHELWVDQQNRGRSWAYFAAFRAYYRLVEARLLPRAAAVLTVSEPIARMLQARYRLRRVDLLPNYPEVDPANWPPVPRELQGLVPGLPADAQVVLYLGAILPARGLESLVDAMAALGRPAHLVMLGSGGMRDELAARAAWLGISERVHVLPPVPSDDVLSFAADATIGVSPIAATNLNYRLSLPNKLFQYMAAGLPVVASDFPQVREVIEGSRAGRCVDTADVAALASAIDGLLGDPVAAREAGEAGRRAVLERYRWDRVEDTLLAIYARLSGPADGGTPTPLAGRAGSPAAGR